MSPVPISPFARMLERVVRDDFDGVQGRLAEKMGVSPQTVSRYKHEYPLKTIVPSVLVAFARASGIALVEVVSMALQSAELPSVRGETPSLEDAVKEDPTLTQEQKRLVIAVLREARRDSATPPRRGLRAARPDEDPPDAPIS